MLSNEQLNFYAQNGYLLLDSVFTPEEIDECSSEYNKLFQAKENQYNLEAKWKGNWTDSSNESLKVIRKCDNVKRKILIRKISVDLRCYRSIICNVTVQFLHGCYSINV